MVEVLAIVSRFLMPPVMDGANHGKKIETVISIVAEAAMAIKSLLGAA